MDLAVICPLRLISALPTPTSNSFCNRFSGHYGGISFPLFFRLSRRCVSSISFIVGANKRNSESDPVLSPSIFEEVAVDEKDDFEGEFVEDEDCFEEIFIEDKDEIYAGDGSEGGGISLAGTLWDEKVLELAKDVSLAFDGELGIYAFKTLLNCTICVRIENLSKKSGSPDMTDIEAFSSVFGARLDEAEVAGFIPDNISLEVSSPGVERVVRIPQDLDRFKDRPMHVTYVIEIVENATSTEQDGVFRLVSFDLDRNCCTWGLADVRLNREKSGKGRPLSKKQREWRLDTSFDSLRLVRLFSEI